MHRSLEQIQYCWANPTSRDLQIPHLNTIIHLKEHEYHKETYFKLNSILFLLDSVLFECVCIECKRRLVLKGQDGQIGGYCLVDLNKERMAMTNPMAKRLSRLRRGV